ncbi:LmbE family protein [uncultured Woeseiaceae bacterium]|uniref:LmbE family protein n=1 Tax=uncultured Woeseiaceae bacterium TaxID=1983305 RepID=A0A7D9D229_9GAMM|nr:LmbE family protein [uncultured Woeseiaceae bacterium]
MATILVIAPHPDDEVLGAGGFIRKSHTRGDTVVVLTVSGHLPPLFTRESYDTTVREAQAAHKILGVDSSPYLEIPATLVATTPVNELNGRILEIVEEYRPQTVLCPYPDRHVDHRAVFDSAMVATRPIGVGASIELVAAYETLSETHWNAPHIEPNFTPTWVVNVSEQIEEKLAALACFESQVAAFPHPRSVEAARSLAMFRGTQAGFAYGEAYHVIRMCS